MNSHKNACVVCADASERKEGLGHAFLQAIMAHYKALGVSIKRLITDNGAACLLSATTVAVGCLGQSAGLQAPLI